MKKVISVLISAFVLTFSACVNVEPPDEELNIGTDSSVDFITTEGSEDFI